jgi:hypothetical protein
MLKRMLWVLGGLSGIVSVLLIVMWRQATYLPSWYSQSVPTPNPIPVKDATPKELTRKEIWQKVSKTLKQQSAAGQTGTVELKASEMNRLIFSEIQIQDKVASDTKIERILVSNNTQIRDGKLVIGAVINLKELTEHEEVRSGKRADLTQAFLNLPIVKDRPVYIEVEGTPIVKNQQIALDSPRIKLANVSMTVEELSKYLGVSPAFINQRITRERALVPMSVQDVKIQGDTITIRGTAS